MMQLDDVVGTTTTDAARFLEATHRSVRWLDRCIAAHKKPQVILLNLTLYNIIYFLLYNKYNIINFIINRNKIYLQLYRVV